MLGRRLLGSTTNLGHAQRFSSVGEKTFWSGKRPDPAAAEGALLEDAVPEGTSLLPIPSHSRWQTAAPDRRSGSARRESSLPLIPAGKPTWEFGAKKAQSNRFPRASPGVLHYLSPQGLSKASLGLCSLCSRASAGSWEENPPPITEGHPSLYPGAP